MKKRINVLILISLFMAMLLITACKKAPVDTVAPKDTPVALPQRKSIVPKKFSSSNLEIGYSEDNSTVIDLADDSTLINNNEVDLVGNTVTISKEGTYILRGSLSNGQIVVDAKDTDKIQIILDNVSLSNLSSAPIYVKKADKVFIILTNNSKNIISVYGEFIKRDENNVDAAIFSKENIIFNGNGLLSIRNNYGNGITSKDDLVILNGIYEITTSGHAIEGKDSVKISNGEFSIFSNKDGIRSKNKDDKTLGYVYIQDGNFTFTVDNNGIYGSSVVQIDGGNITILTCKEGIESAYVLINGGTLDIYSTDDGINASSSKEDVAIVEINGGDITIVMARGDTDAIDSNGNIYINGGHIDLTCESSLDADGKIVYSGGTVIINGKIITDFTAF